MGSTRTAPPTLPTSKTVSILTSSPFRRVTVKGRMLKPGAMTANRQSPKGRSMKVISPISFARVVRVRLSSASSNEASAVVITAPFASVTRIRRRPACAINGEMAVNKAPARTARRLRGSGSDSPLRKPHTRPSDSRQTWSHSSSEYCSIA